MHVGVNGSDVTVKLTKTEKKQLESAAKICRSIEHVIRPSVVLSEGITSYAESSSIVGGIGNQENTDAG